MTRLTRSLTIALALIFSAPSFAQSFEGLDFSAPKKKKKRSGSSKKKKSTASEKKSSGDDDEDADLRGRAPACREQARGRRREAGREGLDLARRARARPLRRRQARGHGRGADASASAGHEEEGSAGDELRRRRRLRQDRRAAAARRAISLFKDEKYEQAAMAAKELMDDPKLAELRLEAAVRAREVALPDGDVPLVARRVLEHPLRRARTRSSSRARSSGSSSSATRR